jgi:hypothetical protein
MEIVGGGKAARMASEARAAQSVNGRVSVERAMEAAEPQAVKTPSPARLQTLRMQVLEPSGNPLRLAFHQRGEQIQMDLRGADSALTQALRQDAETLVRDLGRAGIQVDRLSTDGSRMQARPASNESETGSNHEQGERAFSDQREHPQGREQREEQELQAAAERAIQKGGLQGFRDFLEVTLAEQARPRRAS